MDSSASNMNFAPEQESGKQSHQGLQVVDHPAKPNHQGPRSMHVTNILKENHSIRNRTTTKGLNDQQFKHDKARQSPSPSKSNREPFTKNQSAGAYEATFIGPALPNHDAVSKLTKNNARAAMMAKRELYRQARREGLAIPDRSGLIPPPEPWDTLPVGDWDYSDGWKNPRIEDLRSTRTRGLFENSPSKLPARDFKIYVAKMIHDASGKEIVQRRIDPADQKHYPKLPSDPTRQESPQSNAKIPSPPTMHKSHTRGPWTKRAAVNSSSVKHNAATQVKVKIPDIENPSSSEPEVKGNVHVGGSTANALGSIQPIDQDKPHWIAPHLRPAPSVQSQHAAATNLAQSSPTYIPPHLRALRKDDTGAIKTSKDTEAAIPHLPATDKAGVGVSKNLEAADYVPPHRRLLHKVQPETVKAPSDTNDVALPSLVSTDDQPGLKMSKDSGFVPPHLRFTLRDQSKTSEENKMKKVTSETRPRTSDSSVNQSQGSPTSSEQKGSSHLETRGGIFLTHAAVILSRAQSAASGAPSVVTDKTSSFSKAIKMTSTAKGSLPGGAIHVRGSSSSSVQIFSGDSHRPQAETNVEKARMPAKNDRIQISMTPYEAHAWDPSTELALDGIDVPDSVPARRNSSVRSVRGGHDRKLSISSGSLHFEAFQGSDKSDIYEKKPTVPEWANHPKFDRENDLGDFSGTDWAPAPIEWDVREKYNYNIAEHHNLIKKFVADQILGFKMGTYQAPKLEMNEEFLEGKSLALGLSEFGPPIDPAEHQAERSQEPYSLMKIHQTAANATERYKKLAKTDESEKFKKEEFEESLKAAKAEKKAKRQMKKESRIEEDQRNALRSQNPFAPAANIYIRPARVKDISQILDIFNHYVTTSPVTHESTPLSHADMRSRYDDAEHQGLPFIVAVSRNGKGPQGHGEKIVGFAVAEDYMGESTIYRHTCEIEVYIKPPFLHHGIGKNLIDCLMRGLNAHYIPKCAVDFRMDPDEIPRHDGGGARLLSHILVSFAYYAEHEQDWKWFEEWLARDFLFEQQGNLKGIGRKGQNDKP